MLEQNNSLSRTFFAASLVSVSQAALQNVWPNLVPFVLGCMQAPAKQQIGLFLLNVLKFNNLIVLVFV